MGSKGGGEGEESDRGVVGEVVLVVKVTRKWGWRGGGERMRCEGV